jgi:putative hydrolase of HD superfamily
VETPSTTSPFTLEALLALTPLERLPRTGWLLAGISSPESVAAHSLGTALVALALGPRVVPALDVDRVIALAVVHDAPEALLTDLPRSAVACLPSGAKEEAERRAAERLLEPLSELAATRFEEFRAQRTREARFARLCDRLHLGLRWIGYRRAGAGNLASFREGIEGLDCAEFGPCARLHAEILRAARVLDDEGRR